MAEQAWSFTTFGTLPDLGGSSWPSFFAAKKTVGRPSVCER
jgi:hypothetical protein